jgi:hypothetical protein
MSEIIFDILHLEQYAIIEGPCSVIVKNNSALDFFTKYEEDGHPRWLLNIKAISQYNLDILKALVATDKLLFYSDVGHLLMTAALWDNQVEMPVDLPAKGEDIIAVFGYVDDILRCTSITLIPRRKPKLFYPSSEYLEQIAEFSQLFKDIENEL